MKSAQLEMVRGSGKAFRDLGYKNADVEQGKAILAAEIIKALDQEGFITSTLACSQVTANSLGRSRLSSSLLKPSTMVPSFHPVLVVD